MDIGDRKRSRLLTTWLTFLALLYGLIVAFSLWDIGQPDSSFAETQRQWLPLFAALVGINIVSLIVLWFRRKVGFYILVVASILTAIIYTAMGHPILLALFPVWSLGTTWTLLQPHWRHFQ